MQTTRLTLRVKPTASNIIIIDMSHARRPDQLLYRHRSAFDARSSGETQHLAFRLDSQLRDAVDIGGGWGSVDVSEKLRLQHTAAVHWSEP